MDHGVVKELVVVETEVEEGGNEFSGEE